MKNRLALVLSAFSAFAAFSHAAEPGKPNILLLYADDLGYGDLRSYNPDPKIPTPHLDRLAAEGIRSRKDTRQPFFLSFAYPSPHEPMIPNNEFDGKSAAGPYGDLICETDDSIGKLLRALDEAGLTDNTLVIFSADKGPECFDHARDKKFGHWSSIPFAAVSQAHSLPFVHS